MNAGDFYKEEILYGGVPTTRADAIQHMEDCGWSARQIDRYLQADQLAYDRGLGAYALLEAAA